MSFHKFKKIEDARSFYSSLGVLLPCKQCRENFKEHWLHLPFPQKLSEVPRWTYDLHQRVNVYLGGASLAEKAPSFDSVVRIYRQSEPFPAELAFLRAIIKVTHPGKNRVTPEYIDKLFMFLHNMGFVVNKEDLRFKKNAYACLGNAANRVRHSCETVHILG
jgi:hypothetical protein